MTSDEVPLFFDKNLETLKIVIGCAEKAAKIRIRNADYIIDMGPGGGDAGGRIVACGTPEQICNDPASITGRYLRR